MMDEKEQLELYRAALITLWNASYFAVLIQGVAGLEEVLDETEHAYEAALQSRDGHPVVGLAHIKEAGL